MKTVWGVSKGSYSDYRVLCICASKEVAKAIADERNKDLPRYYDEAVVEEFVFLDEPPEKVATLSIIENLWDDGTTGGHRINVRTEWPYDTLYTLSECGWRWVRAPIHEGGGGRLEVYGTDHERVRKTFSDKRAELLATPLSDSRELKGGR